MDVQKLRPPVVQASGSMPGPRTSDEDEMTYFPVRLYIKQYHHGTKEDWFWTPLCIVYNKEALGFLERLLGSIEHKIAPVDPPSET